jgi:hypothetical protein
MEARFIADRSLLLTLWLWSASSWKSTDSGPMTSCEQQSLSGSKSSIIDNDGTSRLRTTGYHADDRCRMRLTVHETGVTPKRLIPLVTAWSKRATRSQAK